MAIARPDNVGILAMEVHFPADYVDQREMEVFDGVGTGKYTLGLGQLGMAVPGDREDVNALALTVVSRLLRKFDVAPSQVGRLEVGTETLVDKSKSTKTVLMQLFGDNTDVDGVTTINACYGGTAALLNAVAWVQSAFWDGRYAIVVAADIAAYAKGPARPSGGCGAVAMLIGPDAPLVLNCRSKATHAANVWDFYKPEVASEYPTVDGSLSQSCYLHALDECYELFCRRMKQQDQPVSVAAMDYVVFHSPYNKLVQKSFARLLFLDARRAQDNVKNNDSKNQFEALAKWTSLPLAETLGDRALDLAARGLSKEAFKLKVAPGCTTSQQVGNCYTASVYVNLATLVHARATQLTAGARVLLFSYGSGSMATMLELQSRTPTTSAQGKFSLLKMAELLALTSRLERRNKKTPEQFDARMALRQQAYGNHKDAPLTQPIEALADGDYYLTHIDDKGRRFYACADKHESVSTDMEQQEASRMAKATHELAGAVYVAGTSVGLPGQAKPFEGTESVAKLLRGENCIQPLSDASKDAMLALNVVQVRKDKATGATKRLPVSTREQCIQVAAVVEQVDLEKDYGIAATIARSMDVTTQLAVAAGLEALRDAGLVDGEAGNWRLPERLRDSTGVIFASSFPTSHAAVMETSRFYQTTKTDAERFEMDRKLLFRLLVLANAQLAQLIGARGPNTQSNAACAGATQALGMAQDWITTGKCERVVVVASDAASSQTLLPLIGGGFRVLGAACTAPTVELAARPFDAKRSGMILGSGAMGMVLESPRAFAERPLSVTNDRKVVRLLATQFSNSAFHGAALEPKHVAAELVRFLQRVERDFSITREQLARHGVFYSHETGTNASPTASCAYTEVTALRTAFGPELLAELMVANTKGFTGHPMAVAFEDVAAVEGLRHGCVPPVVHFETHDTNLGDVPLRVAPGGAYTHQFALRFAAGFGSQLAFSLYALQNN